MARSLRIEYPGAFYHVMARGNRREKIFVDDDDRRYFLKAVSEACGMTGWRGPCLGSDEQPLPLLYRDAGGQSGGWDEVAAERLYAPVQYTAPCLGPIVWSSSKKERCRSCWV